MIIHCLLFQGEVTCIVHLIDIRNRMWALENGKTSGVTTPLLSGMPGSDGQRPIKTEEYPYNNEHYLRGQFSSGSPQLKWSLVLHDQELQSLPSRTYPSGPDPLRTLFPGPDSDPMLT